jgi:hypothetical protein
MKRFMPVLGLILALGLILVTPASAGGWAVITLDTLPGEIAAGQPMEIGFMVRQHGVTPMAGLTPVVHANLSGSRESVTVNAKAEGQTGHYTASLTLPQTGTWEWTIAAFTVNQPMPALTVVASTLANEKPIQTQPVASPQWLPWTAGFLGIAGILVGLVIAFRQKARWAIALVLAGLLLSAGSIVSVAAQPEAESEMVPQVEAEVVSVDASVSQVDLGRDLFIAKGCMSCHSHSETNSIREFGVDMGPDLTNLTASPEYLRVWLKNPLAAKSTAQMPDLGLSEAEIEALIAFINEK